jgi:hypothetical protein
MTSGFYKFDNELMYGPNYVLAPSFQLYRENKDEYEYPLDGWYWFDSEDEANRFFGIVPDLDTEKDINTTDSGA